MFLPVSRPASMQALENEAQSNLKTLLRDCDRVQKDSWCSSWCYSQSSVFNRLPSPNSTHSGTSLSPDLEEVEWPRNREPLSSSLRVAPGLPRTLDKQTNWSGCLPLPTPEQRMREHAESISTDIISIDVSGSNFERQASMRRSLLYTEGTLNRRIKNSRRKTISGVPDKMQNELASASEWRAHRGRSLLLPSTVVTASKEEEQKGQAILQASPVKKCLEIGRTVAPSVRRIRAQRGHGIAAQVFRSSVGNEAPVAAPDATGPMGVCANPNKTQPIAEGNILAMALAGFSRSQTSCESSSIKLRKGRPASIGTARPRSEEIPVAAAPRTLPVQTSFEPSPLHPALSLPQALHYRPENSWKLRRAEVETTADALGSVSDGSNWELVEVVQSQSNYNGDAERTWWCWEDSVGEGSSIPDSASLHSMDVAGLSESGQTQTTLGHCGWSNGGGSDVASTCSTLSRSFCLRKTREKPQPPQRTDSLGRPVKSPPWQIDDSNHNAGIINEDSQEHCRPRSNSDINVTFNGCNSTPSTPSTPRSPHAMPFPSQKPKETRAMSRTFRFTKHPKPCIPERQSSLGLSETVDSRWLPQPPSELLTPTLYSFPSCNDLGNHRPLPSPSAILPQGTLTNLRYTSLELNSMSTTCPPTPPPKPRSPVCVANSPISTDHCSNCIAGPHKLHGHATFDHIHPQSQFCEDSLSSSIKLNTMLANKGLALDKRASCELPAVKVADLLPPCTTDCLEYSFTPLPPPSPYDNPPPSTLPTSLSPGTMPQQPASMPPLRPSTSSTLPSDLNHTSTSPAAVFEDLDNELVPEQHQNHNPEEHIENSQERIVKPETEKQLDQDQLQCTIVTTKPSGLRMCPRRCSFNSPPTRPMPEVIVSTAQVPDGDKRPISVDLVLMTGKDDGLSSQCQWLELDSGMGSVSDTDSLHSFCAGVEAEGDRNVYKDERCETETQQPGNSQEIATLRLPAPPQEFGDPQEEKDDVFPVEKLTKNQRNLQISPLPADNVNDGGSGGIVPEESNKQKDMEHTSVRTTEDLFAEIHRTKRRVLGRDMEPSSSRARHRSASPPTSRQLPGPMARRRQNPGNEEFKALLLRKGSRMDTTQRMSAVDMLRIGQGDTSPSSSPLASPERSLSKRYVSEGIALRSEGALTPGGVRLGRSKTPPSAGSSRFNSRSRLHSLPMQAISEGEGEHCEGTL
uniref:NHS-like protein 1 n=1 Tax=Myxine glutinosa TaxID=7769 RepID=UPI00358FAC43